MVKESFGVGNLSYKDNSNDSDYLLTSTNNKVTKYNFPVSGPEYNTMFPSELIEFTSTDEYNKINAGK